jgi:hypothetical protein
MAMGRTATTRCAGCAERARTARRNPNSTTGSRQGPTRRARGRVPGAPAHHRSHAGGIRPASASSRRSSVGLKSGPAEPERITQTILESYQRWLWAYRKKNGYPLGISSQRAKLCALMQFFAWLCKRHVLEANPASEIEYPGPRLP